MAEDIAARITGTVWQVHVAAGDRVEEGDDLVVLESMKMEIPVEAPTDGVVVAVHVEAGAAVDEGAVLVTLEPD